MFGRIILSSLGAVGVLGAIGVALDNADEKKHAEMVDSDSLELDQDEIVNGWGQTRAEENKALKDLPVNSDDDNLKVEKFVFYMNLLLDNGTIFTKEEKKEIKILETAKETVEIKNIGELHVSESDPAAVRYIYQEDIPYMNAIIRVIGKERVYEIFDEAVRLDDKTDVFIKKTFFKLLTEFQMLHDKAIVQYLGETFKVTKLFNDKNEEEKKEFAKKINSLEDLKNAFDDVK